jgi:hypothetical protein
VASAAAVSTTTETAAASASGAAAATTSAATATGTATAPAVPASITTSVWAISSAFRAPISCAGSGQGCVAVEVGFVVGKIGAAFDG